MKFKTNQKISRLKHQINSIYMSLGQTADIFPILITLLRSYFIIIMNFDNDDAIDTLIGRLIAFIIMFEKKIENIKCKIAGSQRFHTRLAFQILDLFKKNEIDTECLFRTLGNTKFQEKQASCGLFLRKYSKNNAITYDEFLKLLAPKGNRALSQGMLIRTYQKGTSLQASLWEWVLELLQLYIKMCSVTESIRIAIQQSEDLSYLQLIEFFSLTIKSGSSLINFMNRCSTQNQEYDIEAEDAVYLSYHLKSGHQLSDFTDIDIKQLLFPLNHSFQKQNTTQTTFYKQTMHPKTVQQNQTKQINFLGKTYQKMFHNKEAQNGKFSKKQNLDSSGYTIVNSNRLASVSNPTSRVDKSYGALYIDNFTRSGLNPVLELNQFIAENRENKKEVEFFHDDLNSNYSSLSRQSKESAFDRS